MDTTVHQEQHVDKRYLQVGRLRLYVMEVLVQWHVRMELTLTVHRAIRVLMLVVVYHRVL